MKEQALSNGNGAAATTTAVPAVNLKSSSKCCQFNSAMNDVERFVVVRYFLDRPGYNLENASARFWKNPPQQCHASDIKSFLIREGIIPTCDFTAGTCDDDDDDNLLKTTVGDINNNTEILAEVYMDSFGAFIVLDVAEENGICFDFSNATKSEPARIDIRLTDLNDGSTTGGTTKPTETVTPPQNCSMSPAGLFAFTMINGLEGIYMLMELTDGGFVSHSYMYLYGPYAFFVGGLLQLLVAMWEVTRNNIYGATAFACFGCFWMANGTMYTLKTYFPSQVSEEIMLSGADEWGHAIRECYILFLVVALLKLTFTMNKTTTALIITLIVKLIFAVIEEFNEILLWIHCVLTFLLSFFAGYVFYAEFVNEVYSPPPFNLYPWNPLTSSEEVFGARGRLNGLQPRAIRLRLAKHNKLEDERSNVVNNLTIRGANFSTSNREDTIHVKEA